MTFAPFSGSIHLVNKEVQYLTFLDNHGFVPKAHAEHFGWDLKNIYYSERFVKNQDGLPLYEYVSLIFHDGKFCEAVYESYINKKNSYAGKGKDEKPAGQKYSKFEKSGQKPVFALLYRDLGELEKKLNE